ncbi:MAG TPA: hypothetical protein VGI72_06395 [Gaiellales bacterium]|jgi:hypothetical protein
MAVKRTQLALGTVAALVVLIGPAPADITGLFDHPPPRCLQSHGCGHTHAWWDRPVLVTHVAEAPLPPRFTHSR